VEAWQANRRRATEDTKRAQELASRADPRIRVASIEYDIAGEYCDLTFAANERVGFDWLQQQAADLFHADVSVQQVGDRDRAKALGGLGVCGLALCCATWQTEFPSISIKMAKEQDLSPNPAKISGVCGRLLCCLSFEVEAYRELRGDLPQAGKRVTTPVGRARVLGVNVFKQTIRLRMEGSGEVIEMSADEMRQQYGTSVRPVDLDEQVEAPVRRQDRQRRESALAPLEAISSRRPGPDSKSETEPSAGADDAATTGSSSDEEEPRKRRRRRGRRGGRRRRGGGGSGSSEA
jgi:cell fate regulator YaaT (PSP1 superfamily)